jgi:hypothetical protein
MTMKEGIVALLGLLAVGTALAQPAPAPALSPPGVPGQAATGAGPAPNSSWEAIITSAARPTAPEPAAQPPCEEPYPAANHFWFRADYLLWWTKMAPVPTPLLTTGPAGAAIVGGLTQPGTQVLFGGSEDSYGTTSGERFSVEAWLDTERTWGLAANLFFLEQRALGFGIASNAAGSPVLAQPLINPATGQEFTELIALPGLIAGGTAITSHLRLRGWEIDGLANVVHSDRLRIDLLAGFRAADLDEDLQVASAFTPLAGDFLTFQGAAVGPGSTLTTFDAFQAHNHFYGFQLGGRAGWEGESLSVDATAKVALGGSQELVQVVGASGLTSPSGAVTSAAGGVLAVGSNSGRHFRDEFAVLPEVGLQVRWRFARHMEASFGYSFLYWSDVARPGNQVNRGVEPAQIPTDPAFSTAPGTRPTFQFHSSDYWAQGLNFGLTFRY